MKESKKNVICLTISILRMSWYFERDLVQCSDICLLLSEVYCAWKVLNICIFISWLNPLPKKRFLCAPCDGNTHSKKKTAQEKSFVTGLHNSKSKYQCKIYSQVSLWENSSLSFFETRKNSVSDISKSRNADLSYHPGISLSLKIISCHGLYITHVSLHIIRYHHPSPIS